MQTDQLEQHFEALLFNLLNLPRDHNLADTPKRLAKLWREDYLYGLFHSEPTITRFPNVHELDELYTVGPIPVRSLCAHHFLPVVGDCWVGVMPGNQLIGLSKFARLAQWCFARPTMQEEATHFLADRIEKHAEPTGLGVIVRAAHACMTYRGVKASSSVMTTSVMRGAFRDKPHIKQEFMSLIDMSRSNCNV